MFIFYDCKFTADGQAVDLVSLGMVREDGNELYAVSSELDMRKMLSDPWLRENVWPALPQCQEREAGASRCWHGREGHLDPGHRAVCTRTRIRRMVEHFVASTPHAELWSWYADYAHVALTQLWGGMSDLHPAIPTHTLSLQQEARRLGEQELPEREGGHRDALSDARHCRAVGAHLFGLTV